MTSTLEGVLQEIQTEVEEYCKIVQTVSVAINSEQGTPL